MSEPCKGILNFLFQYPSFDPAFTSWWNWSGWNNWPNGISETDACRIINAYGGYWDATRGREPGADYGDSIQRQNDLILSWLYYPSKPPWLSGIGNNYWGPGWAFDPYLSSRGIPPPGNATPPAPPPGPTVPPGVPPGSGYVPGSTDKGTQGVWENFMEWISAPDQSNASDVQAWNTAHNYPASNIPPARIVPSIPNWAILGGAGGVVIYAKKMSKG